MVKFIAVVNFSLRYFLYSVAESRSKCLPPSVNNYVYVCVTNLMFDDISLVQSEQEVSKRSSMAPRSEHSACDRES
jgi:hypothetical protein